jgi:diguanylate cyclase (GGDEF)-like protein/PAS domain S-box-containing protein
MRDTVLSRWLWRHAPLLAGLTVLAFFAGLLYLVESSERARLEQQQRSHVLERISTVRARLESHLNQIIASARGLAVVYATHPNLSRDDFSALAREIAEPQSSIINVGLVRGTVLTYVFPVEGSEKAIGLDFRQTPSMWPVYERMMSSRRIVVAGPVALVQGGLGVIIRIPVFRAESSLKPGSGKFIGAISIPLKAEEVFKAAGLPELDQTLVVAVRGRDGKGAAGETFHGDPDTFDRSLARQEIVLPGGTWEIAAYPRPDVAGLTSSLELIRFFGGVLCFLAGVLAYGLTANVKRRARDERRVRRAHRRLETVLNAIPDLMFELDIDGHYRNIWSGRSSDRLVVAGDGMTGRSVHEVLPADAAGEVMSALAEADAAGTSHGRRIMLPLPQGFAWFELSVAKIEGRGDESSGFIVLSRDISERHQAEEELRIAATAFQAQEGIVITDAMHRIIRINRAFSEITGYTPEEVIGMRPSILKSGLEGDGYYRRMNEELVAYGLWKGEIRNRRKSGEVYVEWLTITAVRDPESGATTHYVGTFFDITERKATEERVRHLAFFDPLTQLPNRRLLQDRLIHAMNLRSERHSALLLLDLDDFKRLNDTLGHDTGDRMLVEAALRIRSCVREGDTLARWGGDEFVVILERLDNDPGMAAAQSEAIAEKIRAALATPFHLTDDGAAQYSSTSIGITIFRGVEKAAEDIFKQADLAMYQSKQAGRNTIRFFDPTMQAAIDARSALEGDLRRAITQGELSLHYQAQVDANGRPVGAEALLRWHHPQRGFISPVQFIPLAEETGLIIPIGQWVIEQGCATLAAWAGRPGLENLSLAINLSVRQFRSEDFVWHITETLDASDADASRLKLEITESLVLEQEDQAIEKMNRVRDLGVSFAMDDFGTGYASLSHLQKLPIDQLKIDQTFVRGIGARPGDTAIVQSVLGLGRSLGLAVIAEGVETEAQREFLARSGCHLFQGYLFARPLPLAEFEAYIAAF